MRLLHTPEQIKLLEKVKPYLNEKFELSDDAPEQIKKDFEEYKRLRTEQWEFAESL